MHDPSSRGRACQPYRLPRQEHHHVGQAEQPTRAAEFPRQPQPRVRPSPLANTDPQVRLVGLPPRSASAWRAERRLRAGQGLRYLGPADVERGWARRAIPGRAARTVYGAKHRARRLGTRPIRRERQRRRRSSIAWPTVLGYRRVGELPGDCRGGDRGRYRAAASRRLPSVGWVATRTMA
jgi:hypothetical protein